MGIRDEVKQLSNSGVFARWSIAWLICVASIVVHFIILVMHFVFFAKVNARCYSARFKCKRL